VSALVHVLSRLPSLEHLSLDFPSLRSPLLPLSSRVHLPWLRAFLLRMPCETIGRLWDAMSWPAPCRVHVHADVTLTSMLVVWKFFITKMAPAIVARPRAHAFSSACLECCDGNPEGRLTIQLDLGTGGGTQQNEPPFAVRMRHWRPAPGKLDAAAAAPGDVLRDLDPSQVALRFARADVRPERWDAVLGAGRVLSVTRARARARSCAVAP
jgi:hypothetical protein